MKPYPFVGLNHLTVPVATACSIVAPVRPPGRSNLSLRVSVKRLALSGHFLRARTQSGHWSPVLNWLMCKLTKSFPGDVAMKIDGGCHLWFYRL